MSYMLSLLLGDQQYMTFNAYGYKQNFSGVYNAFKYFCLKKWIYTKQPCQILQVSNAILITQQIFSRSSPTFQKLSLKIVKGRLSQDEEAIFSPASAPPPLHERRWSFFLRQSWPTCNGSSLLFFYCSENK